MTPSGPVVEDETAPPRGLRLLTALAAVLMAVGVAAESAEARVGASYADRVLEVRGSNGPETIVIECSPQAEVLINGQARELLENAPLPCDQVAEIDVFGKGGSDRIDLTGVSDQFGDARFDGFGTGTLTAVLPGRGNDRVRCGEVFCWVPDAGPGNDLIEGSRRRDLLYGGDGNDRMRGFGGRDLLAGRNGSDRLWGGADDDLLSGNRGNDRGSGGAGDDLVGGGSGRDWLKGGTGNDELIGGPDRDRLDGGPGRNRLFQDFP